MTAYLQTRGTARAADYAFLGRGPDEPWWRRYRDHTAFDHPTVLVESDGLRWRVFLSGIPSARVDAVGTVVRFTLALDGVHGTGDAAVAAAAAWVADVATGTAVLTAALDACFPAAQVEALRAAGRDDAAWARVQERVLAALGSLPAPSGGDPGPASWFGDVGSPRSRAAFTARVGELVAGAPGRAALLNLVGGPDDVVALLDDGLPVAVLVEGHRGGHGGVLELSRGKALTPPSAARRVVTTASRTGLAVVTGLAVLLAAAVLVVLALLL